MRYDDRDQESGNVEDRRGEQGGAGGFPFPFPRGGGGGMPFPLPGSGGRGGFSLTTLLIIGALMLLFGFNPLDLLRGGAPGGGGVPQMPRMDPGRQAQPSPTSTQRTPFDIPGLPGGRGQSPTSSDEMKVFIARVLARH